MLDLMDGGYLSPAIEIFDVFCLIIIQLSYITVLQKAVLDTYLLGTL